MQINTKFNIGQELYVCTDIAAKQNQCSICHGYGKVMIKYESFICPKCQGASAHQPKSISQRKLKIFTYGFYIGMILWMCGLVASMIVGNVTIKMLLVFIPLAIYQFFTIGKGIIEDKIKRGRY